MNLKWFTFIYTLYYQETPSAVEIATEIGYTHPSAISLLKELEKQKLICSKKDEADERRRLIMLTAKGRLKAIGEAEENLANQGFLQRALQIKNKIGKK